MPISPGTRLGPYEILAVLGTGGMGEVYRASDPRLHREVAVKVASSQFTERSAREARLAAALNHPNVCHIYDVGPNYLVMELVEGPTLADRLEQGPLPLDEALGIARQIGDALEAAHEKGIVHRDLKPGNIKIKPDGTVKVLDFGLAKSTEAAPAADPANAPTLPQEQMTLAGVVMGTAAYMAPEQARGNPVDKRADIWAFGVVLYEMVTGKRPFRGKTISDVLASVLTKDPDWSLVPPPAERLLRRCLEKDPKQRLRDIADARFLSDEKSLGKTDKAPRSSGPWKILTAATVALLLAALASLWMLTRRTTPPVLQFSVDFGEDVALTPRRGATIAVSPDGSRVVFVTGQQLGKSKLAVRRLDQPKSLPLDGTEGAEAPFFSPDSKSIGFFAQGELKKIDASGGVPVSLCDAPRPREGSWGDDGNIIFAATNNGGLSRVSASGGSAQFVTTLDPQRGDDSHRYPQVLPGAQAVLFMNSINVDGEGAIEVQSLKTGTRKTLVQEGAYPRYLPSGHLLYMHRGTLLAAPLDIGRLELTGTAVPLLEDVGFYPGTGTAGYSFSQTGMFVYVAARTQDQTRPIGVMDEKGNIDLLPVPKGRYSHPRVSPDGSRLAVNVRTGPAANVWIYEWPNRRFSRIAFPNGDSNNAIWTPDGKHLVFYSNAQTPGPGIYWMRADSAGAPMRLVEGRSLVPNFFSKDAASLVYDVQEKGSFGLWTVPVDWSGATPKAGMPHRLSDPMIEGPAHASPDGRWLAYISAQSGTPEVLVRPTQGPGGPWQVLNGSNSPFWSPNGRELFYVSLPYYRITVSSYTATGDSFSPATPRVWSETRVESYHLMPDGKRVVMIPAAEQKETTHATFLLNFMDDLRKRVPPGK